MFFEPTPTIASYGGEGDDDSGFSLYSSSSSSNSRRSQLLDNLIRINKTVNLEVIYGGSCLLPVEGNAGQVWVNYGFLAANTGIRVMWYSSEPIPDFFVKKVERLSEKLLTFTDKALAEVDEDFYSELVLDYEKIEDIRYTTRLTLLLKGLVSTAIEFRLPPSAYQKSSDSFSARAYLKRKYEKPIMQNILLEDVEYVKSSISIYNRQLLYPEFFLQLYPVKSEQTERNSIKLPFHTAADIPATKPSVSLYSYAPLKNIDFAETKNENDNELPRKPLKLSAVFDSASFVGQLLPDGFEFELGTVSSPVSPYRLLYKGLGAVKLTKNSEIQALNVPNVFTKYRKEFGRVTNLHFLIMEGLMLYLAPVFDRKHAMSLSYSVDSLTKVDYPTLQDFIANLIVLFQERLDSEHLLLAEEYEEINRIWTELDEDV
jgi:hypothetical protein